METLPVEPFPADLWPRVVMAAKLTPQQRASISEAYHKFAEGTAKITQQQQILLHELQATMGVGAAVAHVQNSSAAAAAAAIAADAGPSGPAHFMSLATGGPVPASDAAISTAAATGTSAAAVPGGTLDVMKSPIRWGHADTPLSTDELQFLTEWLQDCKEQSSAAAAADASSSWLAPAGVLALPDAEKADVLMQQLSRIAGGVKQHLHELMITVSKGTVKYLLLDNLGRVTVLMLLHDPG